MPAISLPPMVHGNRESLDMGCRSVSQNVFRINTLAGIVTAVLFGCASSGLVNTWMDPQYAGRPMMNVIVVAMRPDMAARRLWEDAFADALRERGVTATPSYHLFPTELPDTNGVIAAIRENSYDGCVATVKLPSETLTQDIPGYTTDSLVTRYNPWSNRYYNYYEQVYTPGYTETQTLVRHKIEVWNTTGEGSLVWTATSEALDPSSREAVNDHIIEEVIDDLVEHGVVPGKK